MARRVPTRILALGVAAAALTSGLVAASPPASAQSVKAQIASAQRQLSQLNNQAEAASERYDAARIKLSAAQHSAAAAQQRLKTAQHKVTALQASVTAFAVAAYSGGDQSSLLTLAGGSVGHLIGRMSSLQAVSASEGSNLVGVEAARRLEQQAQVNANAALANQRSATTAMAADRNQILAAASKEQSILGGLQAKEAAIIKAAKAAKARAAQLAAERAAAALARQKAAAAAAARAVVEQPVSPPAPTPQPAPHVSAAGGAATAVAWAKAELGKPYVWGAAGPNSFDCSGLAMFVWAKAGVQLAHFTGDQWNEGTHVSQSQLEPGDLVFFAYNTSEPSTIHHVGIYVGGGQMIDAPYTGVDVRYDPAFRSDYIGAVRPG
ncbi:MAG TPA: C40 family peptidase [Mycobacteriales bacterium]|jgi:cell wall-associated NlpC family hydrolase|nr:C40 family peptidase [Mycobacteriales bacterium]